MQLRIMGSKEDNTLKGFFKGAVEGVFEGCFGWIILFAVLGIFGLIINLFGC